MYKAPVFLFVMLFSSGLFAGERMIIWFKDKANAGPVVLTDRAVQRREKNHVSPDEKDLELCELYISALSADGKVLNRSKWLNAVSFESWSLSGSELKEKHSFILKITSITEGSGNVVKDNFTFVAPKALNYGVADTQIRQIGADCLHDMGFTGEGVFLALIDAGFRGMDTVNCFDSVFLEGRILDTYDFVNNTGVYDYSGHGTAVGSCIFGELDSPNNYVGTAPDVDIALYVSEDVSSETLIEEFNLVAALERCDSVGVDLASISLGYTLFDNPSDDHSYWDMDGQTTIAAQGINTAVSKGILVVAAAGNDGPSYISTPCDADSSLCIGAVDNLGNYASFSSVGPASDGQVKPDVMATGKNTWVVLEDESLVMGNGTSFATPLMAGAVACLIQANPQNSVSQVLQAIRQSASQYGSPSGYMGYGIPNVCVANDSLIALGVGLGSVEEEDFLIYPNPVDEKLMIMGNFNEGMGITITNLLGETVFISHGMHTEINTKSFAEGVYFLNVEDKEKPTSLKVVVKH